ncbi:MAG: ABC transporter permease [Bacteroidaceae bacterium]|nr:ABC transporter permease [Bacteroidaceae bacterium]
MSFPLFVAKRIYSHRQDKKRVSKPAIIIATAGIAIGLAVMILSVCVVLGFQNEVKSKVMGFGSHINILNLNRTLSNDTYPIVVNDSLMKVVRGIKGVKHAQRYVSKTGLLKTDDNFQGIALEGVGADFDTTFLASHLLEGRIPQFSDSASSNRIVISKTIANDLGLKLGDKIYAYFIDQNIRARRFTVEGIYQTNLSQYDKYYVYTDIYTVQRLSSWEPDQASGVKIQVDDIEKLDSVYDRVFACVNHQSDRNGESYSALTITDINPQIFDWLGLLDLNVWVILVLMIGVAAFTMISGLLIIILERTNMIGILKALGGTNRAIRHIFLYFSSMIIIRAMVWGNVIGLGLIFLQLQFGLVRLNPESYYVEVVPLLVNPWLILLINAATLIISVLVLVLPSYLISRIHPAKSIRFE